MKRASNLCLTGTLALALLGSLASLGAAGAPAAQDEKPAKPAIYDEQADAAADIAAALARAAHKNKRVLVQWGANWCGWCVKLHGLFTTDKDVRKELLYEYEVVRVDIGKWDKHLDLAQRYGADPKQHGVPYLTVLDAAGQALANQDTGALEQGGAHDPKKVLAFLGAHRAKPQEALPLLDAALARAQAEQKLVFVHFSAPWCGWCRQLEGWMASEGVRALLAKAFVDLEIDVDRMVGGRDVLVRYLPSGDGGLPWFAFVDPEGKALADSNGAAGNVGFPAKDEEIAHFGAMLRKSAAKLQEAEIETLLGSLRAWRDAREAERKAKAG